MAFYEDILDKVRDYIEHHVRQTVKYYDNSGRFPEEHLLYFAQELRVFELLINYPNKEKGLRTFLEIIRLVSLDFSSLASILFTQAIYGIWLLDQFGTDEQKLTYLDDLVYCRRIAAFAFSEQDISLERHLPETTACFNGRSWELTGRKHMVSNASEADVMFVLARSSDNSNRNSLGIFIVDAKSDGVLVEAVIDKSGIRAMPLAPVVFDKVRLRPESLLGACFKGLYQWEKTMAKMRLVISAQSLGIAEGVFQKGLSYAKLKRGFGKRPIDLRLNQLKFADMKLKLAACESYYNAYIRTDMSNDREVSMLKVMTSAVAMDITEEVIRVTGSYSFIADNDIERYVNDAQVTGSYGGSTESLKRRIAEVWL